jgi:hypothetical protein
MNDRITLDEVFFGIATILGVIALSVAFASLLSSAHTFSNNGRYGFIGASPRGVVVFDTATGETEVRQPFASPTTSTTEPKIES